MTTAILPKGRVGFDLAYNHNDYLQNAVICFNDSDTTLPVAAGAVNCNAVAYKDAANRCSLTALIPVKRTTAWGR